MVKGSLAIYVCELGGSRIEEDAQKTTDVKVHFRILDRPVVMEDLDDNHLVPPSELVVWGQLGLSSHKDTSTK